MITNKVELSYTNNISDRPNNLIRMCYKLCNQYKLSVSKMKGFDSNDRNFYVELVGSEVHVKFKHNYEESTIEYEVISNIEIHEKSIANYILNGVTKVNYNKGDIVYDEWSNKYIVKENTNIPLSTNGARHSYRVSVQDCATGEFTTISDTIISTF